MFKKNRICKITAQLPGYMVHSFNQGSIMPYDDIPHLIFPTGP